MMNDTKSGTNTFGPFEVLKQAVARVPAVKYALGIAGIAAAVAIVRTLVTDLRVAVFGIITMMILMAVLFLFAKLTSVASKDLRLAMLTLMWSSLVLTISAGTLLFSSVFFDWPINLRHLISERDREVTKSSPSEVNRNDRNQESSSPPPPVIRSSKSVRPYAAVPTPITSRVAGMVVDEDGRPLQGAKASIDDFPGRPSIETASNGSFVLQNIPRELNDQVRIRISLAGYQTKTRDVIIGRSSPRIILEKVK
jgi:hypothetical protein